jgi:hypothetical protein
MKEHPGHFWICFWLFMIWGFNGLSQSDGKRIADTLARIEQQLSSRGSP